MELISFHLARLVAILDVSSLDPNGRVTAPELFSEFGARYNFLKVPKSLEDMDLVKGVVFNAGRLTDVAIDAITLYPNGLIIDTRSSTDNCEKVLGHIMDTARETLGATVQSHRRHYVSQFYFRSDIKLQLLNPALQKIADSLSTKVSADMNHSLLFEPTAVLFNMDTSQLKIPPTQMTIERKVETPFSENTYFSTAPLRTRDHLDILGEIEKVLS